MAKLPRQNTADGVIDLGPAELLRSRGFHRTGRTFHRRRREFVDSVFFQTFRGAPFSFCVDLSLILPYHHEMARGLALPRAPNVLNTTCLFNTRMVFPTDHGEDHWLVITPERSASSVSEVVQEYLPQALQLFDSFTSVDHLITALNSGDSDLFEGPREVDLAVLLSYTGRRDEAIALLRSLPAHSVPQGLVDRLVNPGQGSPN
jgi:hypothetical protein